MSVHHGAVEIFLVKGMGPVKLLRSVECSVLELIFHSEGFVFMDSEGMVGENLHPLVCTYPTIHRER